MHRLEHGMRVRFTLIEVLIACIILGTVAIVLVGQANDSVRQLGEAKVAHEHAAIFNRVMVDVVQRYPAEEGDFSGEIEETDYRYAVTITAVDVGALLQASEEEAALSGTAGASADANRDEVLAGEGSAAVALKRLRIDVFKAEERVLSVERLL